MNFHANEQDTIRNVDEELNCMSMIDDTNERYVENHPMLDSIALKQIRKTNSKKVILVSLT